MTKVELLAPVGDWNCLKAAVQNGADAVYFGVEQFNARMYAANFNVEDMKQVIAKLTDARVILNKYFSAHYENFTKEEKKLIQEVEGNVFPGHYNNNPVLPDVSGIVKQKPKENPNLPYTSEINEPNVMKSVRYENQEKPIKTILNE